MANPATLTPVVVGPNGTGKITDLVAGITQAALVGGDSFVCQGKEVLAFLNSSGSPITVTVVSVADNFGSVVASHDITLVVNAGKVGIIGPLDRAKYADSNGLAQITYSGVTTFFAKLLSFATTS